MASPPDQAVSPWIQLIPFALVLGIFYFVILLPMKRRQKKVQEFVDGLKVGDRVVSSGLGGIFPKGLLIGTVSMVDPAELELSPRIEVAPAVTFANLEEIQIMLTKGSPIQ